MLNVRDHLDRGERNTKTKKKHLKSTLVSIVVVPCYLSPSARVTHLASLQGVNGVVEGEGKEHLETGLMKATGTERH